MNKITEYQNDRQTAPLIIPKKVDGSRFELDELQDDQRDVAVYILSKMKEWLDSMEEGKPFEPLRMTVQGAGGTGKTVLINTLVTVIREMFQSTDSVVVAAPTGSAAYKTSGETVHRTWSVPLHDSHGAELKKLSKEVEKRLKQKFKHPVVTIIDERSLLSLMVVGYASHNFAQTAYGGIYTGPHSFAGIPILILIGDDCQIPASMSKGIFDCPICDSDKRESQNKHFSKAEAIGMDVILECANDVMTLSRKKRQTADQEEYCRLLDDARISDLSWEDSEMILEQLHLTKGPYTDDDRKQIVEGALFVSANKEPVQEFNFMMLGKTSSPDNPVAVMKSKMRSRSGGAARPSHFDDACPITAMICVHAQVAIRGRNLIPEWGLFNGAIGIVREIVFAPDANPNDGDLPLYVLVEFPCYCGPVWDEKNPKVRHSQTM